MTTWETGVQFDVKGLAQCTEDLQFLNATDDISGFSAPEELQQWNIWDPSEQWELDWGRMSRGEDLSQHTGEGNWWLWRAVPQTSDTLADVSITALHCSGNDSEPHVDCSGFRELLYFRDISTWQGSASADMDVQSRTDDPGVSQPHGVVRQQYLVKIKFYGSAKIRGSP